MRNQKLNRSSRVVAPKKNNSRVPDTGKKSTNPPEIIVLPDNILPDNKPKPSKLVESPSQDKPSGEKPPDKK